MSGDIGIGKLITSPQERDAIHVAVAPVTASQPLRPGELIGFSYEGNTEFVGSVSNPIGIVDPFLPQAIVHVGERFWMFVLPGTIISLRHDWTHPAFAQPAASTPSPDEQKARSEAWLRAFIASADCPDYETVVSTARHVETNQHQWDEDYLHFSGLDAHGEIPDEFWDHMEVVTGVEFPRRPKYFSCSC